VKFLKYYDIGIGTVPIILSCPHGGFLKPKDIPDKLSGDSLADKNKYLITKRIIQVLKENNIQVYYILCKIHRSKIDLNRPPRSVTAYNHSSMEAREIYNYFHKKIYEFSQQCVSLYNRCLFIDLHGFSRPKKNYPDVILGNLFGSSLSILENSMVNNEISYWGFSNMVDELSKHYTLDDGLGKNDFNLAYSGGYITHRFYRKNNINAFQLEVAKYIREDVELTKIFVNSCVSALLKSLEE